MRRIFIAGVTGSIGRQALDILASIEDLEVVGVAAGANADGLLRALELTGAKRGALEAAESSDDPRVLTGSGSAVRAIGELEPDLVLNAVVGFAGLSITRAALLAGADVALANKESLVVAGDLVMPLAAERGRRIDPVDSEHASLAQLLSATRNDEVEAVTLTASGGPFRGYGPEQLRKVTRANALAHPTWNMGGKITVDSATLMNKGLELIEAHHLFGLEYDCLGVVVHPQSIVHALVSLVDGMQLAHLGLPDMRAPIAWALAGRGWTPRLRGSGPDLFPSLAACGRSGPRRRVSPGCPERGQRGRGQRVSDRSSAVPWYL